MEGNADNLTKVWLYFFFKNVVVGITLLGKMYVQMVKIVMSQLWYQRKRELDLTRVEIGPYSLARVEITPKVFVLWSKSYVEKFTYMVK